jgi:HEAT repeat protein
MRTKSWVVLLVLVAVAFAEPPAVVGIDSLSMSAIEAGMDAQGMRVDELGFFKQWAVDSFFRLKVVDRLLDHPLEVVAYTESTAARTIQLESLPAAKMLDEWRVIDCGIRPGDSAKVWREVETAARADSLRLAASGLPQPLSQAIILLLGSYRVGDKYLNQAIARLSPFELDGLLGEGPDFWKDEDDSVEKSFSGKLHREFGKEYDTSRQFKSETLCLYVRKLDRHALAMSGMAVVMAAAEARRLLAAGPLPFPHETEARTAPGVDGGVMFDVQTEFGRVVVGGAGDNVYHDDCCILIDVGGNDRYMNRAGGAVGFLSQPFSTVIDLAGNDYYYSDRLFSQGAAMFGAGVLIDCGGDDVYRASHYSQGASMFGTGLLWDMEGTDIYDAGFFAQGASDFGTALLADNSGNDNYRCWCYGQGFASTWAAGTLADFAGNDVYTAGGKYLHVPLLPHEYRSFSHGFAIGRRPDTGGGVALLCDQSGNDFYDGEVFCEGTSYWYSLGMLWDGSGYDHYTAAQYTQGAGIHLSIGALVDEGGCDSYMTRLGPAQGQGHDLSVGALVDRGGDDYYCCSGGQGIGLTNSAAFLIDEDGNDCYVTQDSLLGQGSSNFARGFGGMGLFVDLAGADKYSQRNVATERAFWTKGTYGSGLDYDRPASVENFEPNVDTSSASIDSVITAPVESVFKTASMWRVGNVVKKVERARKELVKLGPKALAYVADKKMDTKDGLESEAIEVLVKAWPDSAKPYLFKALRDPRYLARNNAAYFLGKLGRNGFDAVESLFVALKAKRISPRRGVYSLGDIGDSLVVPRILYLLKDKMEISRIVTAEACGKLKNPVAIPALMSTLNDAIFTVRSAAEAALVAIGRMSLDSLLGGMPKLKPVALGHALRASGALAAKLDTTSADTQMRDRCRAAFLSRITHPDNFVRIQAVAAGGTVLDDATRAALQSQRAQEKDWFVLTKYREVLDVK